LSSKFNASENFHSLFKHSLVVQFSKDNLRSFLTSVKSDLYNITHLPTQCKLFMILFLSSLLNSIQISKPADWAET
ncbi:hypothetical protein, partial [Paenibacillus sp. OAS669]|uniref:hypothetical protein n=1 Tax=Paenibacillus sp. OAS669 TaxID=2663821 RepID=UPI0019D893DE